MKSALALALVAVAAGQSIPPAEFGLPTAQNNTQLGVAFFPGSQSVVVQPGALFGKQSRFGRPQHQASHSVPDAILPIRTCTLSSISSATAR